MECGHGILSGSWYTDVYRWPATRRAAEGGVMLNNERIAKLTERVEKLEQQLAQAHADAATMRGLLVGLADDLELECPNNPRSKEAYAYLAAHPTQA
jgi:hypothetical protein